MNDTALLGEDLKEDLKEDTWRTPTNITVVVMLSVFSVVGVVGNAIVIYIFFRRRNSSTSVIFILALAGTDFITCLVTIPYTIVHELLHYDLVFDLACKTYMFLITSTVPFSAYIMVGIALDRYFCICHPFLYVVTIRRAKAIIFCMSIPALTFGILTALMHGTYVYREKHLPNITKWFNVSDDDIASQHKLLKEMYRAIPPIPGSRLDTIYTHPSSSSRGDTRGSPTNYTTLRFVDHIKTCVRNDFVFSNAFVTIYTKIHAAGFVLAYIFVAVLYILIYKAIYTRRANKAKRKKKNMYPLLAVAGKTETSQMSMCINGGPTTSVGNVTAAAAAANNQQKPGLDQVGARKIVLTARDDAGILPVSKTDVAPTTGNGAPLEDWRQISANVDYSRSPERDNGVKSNEKNAEDKQERGVITSRNGNTARASTLLLQGDNPGPDEHERGSVNECRKEEDEEEEEEGGGGGSHIHTPLMLSVNNAEAQSTATYLSTNSLVSLQSPSHSRNTLHQQQQQQYHHHHHHKQQQQQQQLENASLNNNSRKEGQGGNNATSPSVAKDATSTSALPAEVGTTTTTTPQTITITFNHVKSTETKHKSKHLQTDAQLNSIKRKRQSTLRHRNLVANIKTAFMLFIVTLVFIIAFLPALLMAQGVLPLNLIAFYVYFVYNVANPFIYAFMNQTFREDLKKIVNILCSR